MSTAILSVKGQIVIPKKMRQAAKLSVGNELCVSYVSGEIRLRLLATNNNPALEQVAGCLARPRQAKLSDLAVKLAIQKS